MPASPSSAEKKSSNKVVPLSLIPLRISTSSAPSTSRSLQNSLLYSPASMEPTLSANSNDEISGNTTQRDLQHITRLYQENIRRIKEIQITNINIPGHKELIEYHLSIYQNYMRAIPNEKLTMPFNLLLFLSKELRELVKRYSSCLSKSSNPYFLLNKEQCEDYVETIEHYNKFSHHYEDATRSLDRNAAYLIAFKKDVEMLTDGLIQRELMLFYYTMIKAHGIHLYPDTINEVIKYFRQEVIDKNIILGDKYTIKDLAQSCRVLCDRILAKRTDSLLLYAIKTFFYALASALIGATAGLVIGALITSAGGGIGAIPGAIAGAAQSLAANSAAGLSVIIPGTTLFGLTLIGKPIKDYRKFTKQKAIEDKYDNSTLKEISIIGLRYKKH